MAIQTATTLKSYFNTGDRPTEQQFADLIDSALASNLRTVKYVVGVAGTTGCNHLFTSVANTTEQSIQLGGTTIIPAKSLIDNVVVHCLTGLNTGTGTADVGNASGGSQFASAINVDGTGEIVAKTNNTVPYPNYLSASASSVYFSFTPSANWDTLTTGKWEIFITYIDNSTL